MVNGGNADNDLPVGTEEAIRVELLGEFIQG